MRASRKIKGTRNKNDGGGALSDRVVRKGLSQEVTVEPDRHNVKQEQRSLKRSTGKTFHRERTASAEVLSTSLVCKKTERRSVC